MAHTQGPDGLAGWGESMKGRSSAGLYLVLAVFIALSMGYYVAGALALRQEFFHAAKYTNEPFDLGDDGVTLNNVQREAVSAGLTSGDVLLALNGAPFTGYAQMHTLLRDATPGAILEVSTRKRSGEVRSARVHTTPREGPNFPLGGLIAFLLAVFGVPLFCLLMGYWIVAARPHDPNAWLALMLLTFPETAYGNLDWKFWPVLWLLLGFWNFFVQLLVFPALVWFGFLFPERWRADRRFPWFKYALLGIFLLTFAGELADASLQLFAPSRLSPLLRVVVWIDRLTSTLQVVSILLFLAAIFDKLRSATTQDARRRLRVLAIGSGLSLGPMVLIFVVVPLFGRDPHHGNWFLAIIPCLALFPLTLAYVLIVERAMDVRILLRMGTKYLLARATLLLLEVAVVGFILLRFVIPWMRGGEHQTLKFVLLAVCLAALFQIFTRRDSLGQRLQRWLDRRFFREAYNSEMVLSELSQQVRLLTDRADVIDTVLRRLAEVLHVSEIAILLRGSHLFHLQGALGMELAGTPLTLAESSATVQNLVHTNQPATVYRDRPEEWFAEAGADEKAVLVQMNTELLLPMAGRDRLLGVLALGPKRSEEPYTPTDLRTLQSVAAQTGLTLEVAELAQTLAHAAAQRERVNREIEIAREVQERLFPQTLPRIAGVSLAGLCRPASEVGGDYYDLVELENGQLAFAIGDVSGKGISAALIMASLRASLRGLILDIAGDNPGDLAAMMGKVNRLVYEASSSSRYATFFFATYDPRSRVLLYVNAGHNPPVVVNGGSGALRRLEACGPVVGLLAAVSYEAQSLVLKPGDLLIAYTDGISEAMTAEDEEWGEERMLAAAPHRPGATAAEVVTTVFAAADAFTAGAAQHDDMTLLVMKLSGQEI